MTEERLYCPGCEAYEVTPTGEEIAGFPEYACENCGYVFAVADTLELPDAHLDPAVDPLTRVALKPVTLNLPIEQAEAILEETMGKTMPKELIGFKTIWQGDDPWIYYIQRGMTAAVRARPENVQHELNDATQCGSIIGRVVDMICFLLEYHGDPSSKTQPGGFTWSIVTTHPPTPEKPSPVQQWLHACISRLREWPMTARCKMTYSPSEESDTLTQTTFERLDE